MIKDIENYDYLGLSVHSMLRDEIETAYKAFGWKVVRRGGDSRYRERDLLDLRRPHKIPNKDRLQLLQVHLETALNSIGDAERKRRLKSTAVLLAGLIVGLVTAAIGAYLMIVFFSTQVALGLGIAAVAAGCLLMVATVITASIVSKSEDVRTNDVIKKAREDIYVTCMKAAAFLGANDEQAG